MVGPRGDGYAAGLPDPQEAAGYHGPQLEAFATAGADLATALTLTDVPEAIGIVQAARTAGLPVAISFTVETDGRLPSGPTIADAITTVDATAAPDYYLINCAHPTHIRAGLGPPGPWIDRIVGIRANASLKSHAELDDAEDLDEGDIATLAVGAGRPHRRATRAHHPRRLLRNRPPPRRRPLGHGRLADHDARRLGRSGRGVRPWPRRQGPAGR